jgi:hypothetical protein
MRWSALLVLVAAFLGMMWALDISDTSFARLPHLEDEYAYTYQAKIFAEGNVYVATPEPKRAFWQPFLIDYEGKRFGKYPPGYPMLLAIGYLLGFPAVINAWLLALTIVVTYRLGREVFNEPTGVIAAFLLASSPITLMHSAGLMSHPAALFWLMVCLYGLWRLEKGTHLVRWGMVAGVSLGMVTATRPFVGIAVAIPLVAYSALRVGASLLPRRNIQLAWWLNVLVLWMPIAFFTFLAFLVKQQLPYWTLGTRTILATGAAMAVCAMGYVVFEWSRERVNPAFRQSLKRVLIPLVVMAIFAGAFGALHPAFNYAVTGDPARNLYLFIWKYDQVGFGPGHGRGGRNFNVAQPEAPGKLGKREVEGHNWYKAKNHLKLDTECYTRDLFGWVPQPDNPPTLIVTGNECVKDRRGLSWVMLPVALVLGWRRRWLYVLGLIAVAVVVSTMYYWIGAGVYSARYYYEANGVLAIISAFGIAQIALLLKRFHLHWAIYAIVAALVIQSAYGYTPRRMEPLEHKFTDPVREQLAAVDRWHPDRDKPLLIIAYGDVHWRKVNAFMAQTSPYLDSKVILARDPDQQLFLELEGMFPDYDVIYFKDDQFVPSPFG